MKTMKKTRSILMLLVAMAASTACDKNAVQQIAGPPEGGANIKFFNFAVGSPNVNFYVNDQKVTAASATGCAVLDDANRAECLSTGRESTVGVAYGSAANGAAGWYSDVEPGQVTVSGKIAALTDKNLAISNLQSSVEDGKFYSCYQSGIYDAVTKTADSFIVEDVLPPRDFTVAYVRFVNASSTTQPMTLYAKNRETQAEVAVGGDVAYKSGGGFVAVPVGSYDLSTRVAGSTTNVFSRTGVSFSEGRVYTIAARGNTATASTMQLDNTANR
jgi:hypothetical protein